MGWDGANGDRKRSERAARLLRESLVQLGYPLAVILATAVFALVSQLPEREFLTWGWRVPFLLSAILVGIGLYIRLRLVETPAFRQHSVKSRRVTPSRRCRSWRSSPSARAPFLFRLG